MFGKVKRSLDLSVKEHRSMPSLDLTIVYRETDELKPDPGNPRLHSKKQIRQIADSIKAFGFNVPILIDRDDKVIAGHGGCLPAASSAGARCRPCVSIT
jgi:ParB-like nuclease domain